jgi:hypothetical protein
LVFVEDLEGDVRDTAFDEFGGEDEAGDSKNLEGISGDFLAFGEEEIQKSRGGSIGFTLI